ncbi:hypothetical protein, partial [Roseiarcus sp.]|uniref:hypothetical protein n=1 Tax=Roseiarcus sp. TaxID=1969460 RepID=UPI003F9DC209
PNRPAAPASCAELPLLQSGVPAPLPTVGEVSKVSENISAVLDRRHQQLSVFHEGRTRDCGCIFTEFTDLTDWGGDQP